MKVSITIDAEIGGTWDTLLSCPTCGSAARDVFLPIFNVRAVRCNDGWHEDRIDVYKSTQKPGKAASRQRRHHGSKR